MAGKAVFHGAMPPGANAAQLAIITGASTPTEKIPVWDFDPTTVEYMDFKFRLENYAGGGLTVYLPWLSGATTGNVIWSAAIRAIPDDAEDLDTTAHTYDYNDVTDTTASAAGEISIPTIAFTHGADMDSLANNEWFILRVRRRADQAGDTLNANDARLFGVAVVET